MRQNLLYSILLLCPFILIAQQVKFEIFPFVNGLTSIKDGFIEAGPEFNWNKLNLTYADGLKKSRITDQLSLKLLLRLPLTNKAENVLQVDRFSSTWRSVLALQYTIDNTKLSSKIIRHSFGVQFEYGFTDFKYYPTGNKDEEEESGNSSYSLEVKYIGFLTKGKINSSQFSPQLRLRYSYEWKSAREVGVVNLSNPSGIVTTSNMVIDAPKANPIFSPGFSLQIYSGKGSFSYSPTIYYDFTGDTNKKNPFGDLNRFRLESWFFFYPLIQDNPNVKIGVSPFVSIRTKGVDDFRRLEYGGMFTVKFGTTFLQFF